MRVTVSWRTAVMAIIALSLAPACGGNDDRPTCNLGSCFGDGDADADADTDADGDSDGDTDVDCFDPDGDGHVDDRCEGGDDCDDHDRNVHPGAEEICNRIDDNCADGVDEAQLVDGEDVVLPSQYAVTVHIALVAAGDGFRLLRVESEEVTALFGPFRLLFSELDGNGQPRGETLDVGGTPNYSYLDSIALAADEDRSLALYGDGAGKSPSPWRGVMTLVPIEGGASQPEIVLGDEPGDVTPAIAVGSDTALVVWNHFQQSIQFALLSLSDLSIVSDGELFPTVGQFSLRPSVVWADDHYLVAATANDGLRVATVDEAGALETRSSFGLAGTPFVAYDGTEAAVVFGDGTGSIAFSPLDPVGGLAGPEVDLTPGKLPQIVGIPRSFAQISVTIGDLITYEGLTQFSLLDRWGTQSNTMNPDDAADAGDFEPTVVPAPDGWAAAWIGGDSWDVRMDFIHCP